MCMVLTFPLAPFLLEEVWRPFGAFRPSFLPSFRPSFIRPHEKRLPLPSLPCASRGGSRSGGVGERPIVRPNSCRAGTDHVWKGLLPCCRASERASGHTGGERGLPPFLLSSLSFPRPSTTSCIKSAFSRRHDEGANDWSVYQVKV